MGSCCSCVVSTGGVTSLCSMATSRMWPRCRWGGRRARRCARRGAWGQEPPSGSAAHLTARAFSRGNLESARAPDWPVKSWRLNESLNCLVSVPPRRATRDEASGEDSMLTSETGGRQHHRRARITATHGKKVLGPWLRRHFFVLLRCVTVFRRRAFLKS